MSNNNPTVLLNGDQIYLDELIRENARLTVQHEADRQLLEQMRERPSDAEEYWAMGAEMAARLDKVSAEAEEAKCSLQQAVKDLHAVMAGGDPCKICLNKCPMGTAECKPAWRGSRG